MADEARFAPGQLVRHLRFGYRGVVADVDPEFGMSEEWYEQVARSRPPKDQPWYHVLPDGSHGQTYVAERHLGPDDSGRPVQHPDLDRYFERFGSGRYLRTSN